MATTQEYDAAQARVRAGTASSNDHYLVNKEAQQAGSRGNAARDAQANAGKNR